MSAQVHQSTRTGVSQQGHDTCKGQGTGRAPPGQHDLRRSSLLAALRDAESTLAPSTRRHEPLATGAFTAGGEGLSVSGVISVCRSTALMHSPNPVSAPMGHDWAGARGGAMQRTASRRREVIQAGRKGAEIPCK